MTGGSSSPTFEHVFAWSQKWQVEIGASMVRDDHLCDHMYVEAKP